MPRIDCAQDILGVDPGRESEGIELYPECEYAAAVHYVFDVDELVRYIKFRDFLAGKMKRAQV